jgi:hypothetical protein
MKMDQIPGNTNEEKLANLAKILTRYERRMPNVQEILIPPCPVVVQVADVKEGEPFYSFISPITGMVKSLCAKIEHPSFKSGILEMQIGANGTYSLTKIPLVLGTKIVPLNVGIKVGDVAIFTISSLTPNNVVLLPLSTLLSISICPDKVNLPIIEETIEEPDNEVLPN